MRVNKLLVGILTLVIISGTSSMAFAQTTQTTHSSNAVTGAPSSGPIAGAPTGASDTTASVNYCNGQTCHVDFQDPDGVGSTFASTFGITNFGSCPVGTFGQFTGAWNHPTVGDPVITATDCAGFTTCWALPSTSVVNEISCSPVGGDFIPIDATAVLIAGAQTNALSILGASVAIGAVAFGVLAISIKRKQK